MNRETQFWSRIDQYRKISLKRICSITGLSYATIRSQRSRGRLPSLEDAAAIAEAIEVPLDMLVSSSAEPYRIVQRALRAADADELDIYLIERIFSSQGLPFSSSCAR